MPKSLLVGRKGPSGPIQYGPVGKCACGAELSRYNPYSVCGPCRRRRVVGGEIVCFHRDRRPIGRGPLLEEYRPAELPEPEDEPEAPVDPIPAPGETHG